jgi:prepilin-type N-terminal cleavage/methylation domain
MITKGFSLLELLVTITLGAILLSIAAPGLASLITNNAIDAEASNISNALRSARSHAVDINQHVVVCFADNSNICKNNGFTHLLVFVDKNNDGVLTTSGANPDAIILNGSAFDHTLSIAPDAGSYVFLADGSTSAVGSISVCSGDTQASTEGHRLSVSLSGRTQSDNIACH